MEDVFVLVLWTIVRRSRWSSRWRSTGIEMCHHVDTWDFDLSTSRGIGSLVPETVKSSAGGSVFLDFEYGTSRTIDERTPVVVTVTGTWRSSPQWTWVYVKGPCVFDRIHLDWWWWCSYMYGGSPDFWSDWFLVTTVGMYDGLWTPDRTDNISMSLFGTVSDPMTL